ncbi:hypothetical protein M0P48_05155 [Candidatus Gracilibacteria bacterium]|jgi:hypothetical protein|nr:hypothetical protein [Candidatus Gracilibacteria bacterium]
MLNSVKQSSDGNNSPNIIGDDNTLHFGTKDKLTNEVDTMLNVITLIPEIAREQGVSADQVDHPKDFLTKIEVRFELYTTQLKEKFKELHLLYKNSYDEAKRNSGIDEFGFEEMCNYLRNLSLEILSKNNDNPIQSLKALCDLFEDKFAKGADKNFSAGAIEYFLYKQLVECNVFPNPISE